jgi:leukotriene-A4 hydrolase
LIRSYIVGRKGLKEDLKLFAKTPKLQRMVCELGEFEVCGL